MSLVPPASRRRRGLPGRLGARCLVALAVAASLVAAATTPGAAAPRFSAPSIPYPLGGNSASVVIADMNQDGRPDLVTVAGSAAVKILLGVGDGTFGPYREHATPGGLDRVVVADLNADGLPDLVTTSQTPGTITVLLARGDDEFTRSDIPIGSGVGAIAIGDVNEDGHADLVGPIVGAVAVWPGRGDGSFGPRIDTPVANAYGSIPLGDLNNDGHLDIVMTRCTGFMVMLGAGDGTFLPGSEPDCGDYNESYDSPVLADLNRDGKLDMAATWSGESFRDEHPGAVRTFLGVGTGRSPGRAAAVGPGTRFPGRSRSPISTATGIPTWYRHGSSAAESRWRSVVATAFS